MPRCQRTFYRLGPGRTDAGDGAQRWTCRHCADAEVYETIRDADLLHYADRALAFCAENFGTPPDAGRPTLLLLGLRPECVREPAERRYDLYLQRDADPSQLRLQIGHEMFHRVCSRGAVFHWTHEMLACLVSVRLLRRHGLGAYADAVEADWRAQAVEMTAIEMQRTDLWTHALYPPGFYGRAFVVGAALTEAAGWDRLRGLARCPSAAQPPDVDAWLARLPLNLARSARRVLQDEGDAA